MADQKDNPYQLLWMLGLALTLPMILICGPLAGYFISILVVNHFGGPAFLTPMLMALGLMASGMQAWRLIRRLNQNIKKS